MADIIKVYRQSMPKMKFVGKAYTESDKRNNTFSHIWGEWFEKDLFSPLKLDSAGSEPFEDSNAFYGLSRCKQGEPYVYYIGVFLPEEAEAPEGYDSISFDAFDMAVCWIYGKEPDIYFTCSLERLKQEGYEWGTDKNGYQWCFERYVSPRFTEPDANGNVILDMCFYLKASE